MAGFVPAIHFRRRDGPEGDAWNKSGATRSGVYFDTVPPGPTRDKDKNIPHPE